MSEKEINCESPIKKNTLRLRSSKIDPDEELNLSFREEDILEEKIDGEFLINEKDCEISKTINEENKNIPEISINKENSLYKKSKINKMRNMVNNKNIFETF